MLEAKTEAGEKQWQVGIEAVVSAAKELGTSASQVALAWLLAQPTVSSVIIGVRTLAQLEDNLKASDLALPEAANKKLTELSAPALVYTVPILMRRNDGAW